MRHWIGALLLLAATPALADQAVWDAKFYNPRPANDGNDLELPLPCGGEMTFRPVDVVTTPGPLDDRSVPMGDPDHNLAIAEYIHNATLDAPFPAPGGGRRYWIGKYVVTRDQFDAMRGTCRPPSFGGRVAQTGVAQIDAMQAAAQWSSWLLTHARNDLPKRGTEFAYARLPTEVEWEFAARGGTKVGPEAFRARTWPMPDGIDHYAVAGDVADGRAQQIGEEEKPNPLGLYDILGSVDQIMLEPFRLNRVGRLEGDAGGVILRGGDYKEDLDELHTGERREMRPFDPVTNQPTSMPTVGFRLVLSAPTAGSALEVEAERQAFQSLSQQHTEAMQTDDPRQLVALMRRDATNPAEAGELDRLDASLDSDARARADQDRDALRAQIAAAATMANFVWRLERNSRAAKAMINYVKARAERTAAQGNVSQVPAYVAQFEADQERSIASIKLEQDASLDGYLRFLREIALNPASQEVPQQAAVVVQEMQNSGQRQLRGFVTTIVRHAQAMGSDNLVSAEIARHDILAVPEVPIGQ